MDFETGDGALDVFLGEEAFQTTQICEQMGFPNVVVTLKGTVLAVWGVRGVRVRRSEDGGQTWGDAISVHPYGIHSGGATLDEKTGNLFIFVEDCHPPVNADTYVCKSEDDGKTWSLESMKISADAEGHRPALHMNEHGISLKRGQKVGRLLRASRWYAAGDEDSEFPRHLANLVFSDDGGATWNTSAPFPAAGCGEAGIVELSDGSVYFNTRRHWSENGDTTRRWSASSLDVEKGMWHGRRRKSNNPEQNGLKQVSCRPAIVSIPCRSSRTIRCAFFFTVGVQLGALSGSEKVLFLPGCLSLCWGHE